MQHGMKRVVCEPRTGKIPGPTNGEVLEKAPAFSGTVLGWFVVLASVSSVFLAGCSGPEMPELHPTAGTVVGADAAPMSGGSVRLRSQADAELIINGQITGDGTFALATVKEGSRVEGVPAGTYEVTVVPPMGADQLGKPPVRLPEPVTIAPGENELKLELPGNSR